MSLQWIVAGSITAVETVLLFLVSLPLPRSISSPLVQGINLCLQPLLAVVPFCVFVLLDVLWKYEFRMECKGPTCTSADRDRYMKSVVKNQRNFLLGFFGILLYWILYRYCRLHKIASALQKSAEDAARQRSAEATIAAKEPEDKKTQ